LLNAALAALRERWAEALRAPGGRRIVVSAAAALCFAALGVTAWLGSDRSVTYDAGTLAPVAAAPAEEAERVSLRRGQTLGALLADGPISVAQRVALLAAFRERANPRRLAAGTPVTYWRDRRDGALRAIEIGLSPDSAMYLEGTAHGWSSQLVRTPVQTDTVFINGEIRSNLWLAVVGSPDLQYMPSGDRAKLLHGLDGIFQWEVDFHRQVQPGDSYRVVLERQVRPDGSMRGNGRIVAAEFVNQGTPFHAFWFDASQGGEGAYYDTDGRSVQRQFLLKPLEYRRISSRVQSARFHPVLRRWRAHNGVDYAANTGVPVMATADGVVTHRGWSGSYGNLVEIRHTKGFVTRYAHLTGFASGVLAGGRVRQGETIGFVGMTGLATGPHLHYELRQNGRIKDPLDIRLPPGESIPVPAWSRWQALLADGHALLASARFAPRRTLVGGPVMAEASEGEAGSQGDQ
jgi:murein DD-endopeptidase MepM/ murein hydrolase activator NlpD